MSKGRACKRENANFNLPRTEEIISILCEKKKKKGRQIGQLGSGASETQILLPRGTNGNEGPGRD